MNSQRFAQTGADEPPLLLDAARVLEYASFDDALRASPGSSAVVGGVAVDLNNVAGVVIAEGLAQGELFLLLCNDRWETLAAQTCADVAGAKARAEQAYPALSRLWRAYRELTGAEQAEIASTRNFLRELLAGESEE